MSWNVFPPSVLISSTPPSKPRLGSASDASRLKLCQNVNCVSLTMGTGPCGESRRLSLATAGSSMNAALGGVSAGGIGTPEFDVTQNGGGPSAFVASQSGGNAGGLTLSKFSLHLTGRIQGARTSESAVELGLRRQKYPFGASYPLQEKPTHLPVGQLRARRQSTRIPLCPPQQTRMSKEHFAIATV